MPDVDDEFADRAAGNDWLRTAPRAAGDGARRRGRQLVVLTASATAVAVLATTVTACDHAQRRPARDTAAPPTSAPATSATAASATGAAERLPQGCVYARLPLPPGQTSSIVTGGDRSGHYLVGRSSDAEGRLTVLVWRDGELTSTASMPGDDGTLDDINGSGVAIGNSVPGGDGNTAWLFRDGELTELTVPDNGTAVAGAIGEQGTVVGWRIRNPILFTPVVWQPGQTVGTDLDLRSGAISGRAIDVDADGTIVGDLYSPITPSIEVLWRPGGKAELLPEMKRDRNTYAIKPSSISDGVVAGRSGPDLPTVLDLRTGSFTIIDQSLGAGTVNRKTWFAGRTGQGLGIVSATAWKQLVLPPGTDASSKDTLVKTMSDDGLALGGQAVVDGTVRAIRWRCT